MKPIDVQVTSDFICPWCWIGHRKLQQAIRDSELSVQPRLVYQPYELNPQMPQGGLDRKAYRTAKFGSWARSQAMDAEVAQVGQSVGADFHYERVLITPNTRQAHRLMQFAQKHGDAQQVDVLYESIFFAYFSLGEDIGQIETLTRLAHQAGLDSSVARSFLESEEELDALIARELQAHSEGIASVPTFRINGTQVSGAQPAHVLAAVLSA
ncbi:DsbA family oxidoreductase [Comamonas sp. Tr-654]|uniref:DsbA family oxidoreductase n=1 Tax=Comamonas sp. Tr-654 TaxID=2608341 RepID=UPI00142317F0|nr:DsbA family oxidoreductase [Comamonas sp. Tr-654]NIF85797.1 DsbA family oxidoreductase [Comamonas sp. Tr-654]